MKIMWCMIPKTWSATYRNFSHFGPNSPDNQNYEKMKKTPGDIIILHKCIINDNCMIYGSWDTKCNRQNFFVIRDHFLPFYLSNSLKNPNIKKKKKKKKKPGDFKILHKCAKIHDHRIYCFWDMARDRCDHFSFWAILFPFTP